MDYAKRFVENKSKSGVLMFYLWGHSYEFEDDNNWEIIEQLLERCHDNPDIWFATNMEICQYTNAYYSLHFSADESIVYKPHRYYGLV